MTKWWPQLENAPLLCLFQKPLGEAPSNKLLLLIILTSSTLYDPALLTCISLWFAYSLGYHPSPTIQGADPQSLLCIKDSFNPINGISLSKQSQTEQTWLLSQVLSLGKQVSHCVCRKPGLKATRNLHKPPCSFCALDIRL